MTQSDAARKNEGRTPRGERTRQRLLDAARELFSDVGYEDATIDGIVERAGVGHGTFYLYFSSKEDIFIPIAKEVAQRLQDDAGAIPPSHLSRYERIEYANAAYLRSWIEHRRLMGEFLSQASRIPELAQQAIELRDGFARMIENAFRRRQERGEAQGIDPQIAAYALGGMVSWFAFDWLYRENFPFDDSRFDDVVKTLSRLWYQADGSDLVRDLINEAASELRAEQETAPGVPAADGR